MRMVILMVTMVLLSACGKDVGKNLNPNNPSPPTANPGVDAGSPVSPPVLPSGVINLRYANAAWNQYASSQINEYTFTSEMVLNFPDIINQSSDFSFDPDQVDMVEVILNGQVVCEYHKNAQYNFQPNPCVSNLEIIAGDVLTVEGLPQGETLNLKVEYQRQ